MLHAELKGPSPDRVMETWMQLWVYHFNGWVVVFLLLFLQDCLLCIISLLLLILLFYKHIILTRERSSPFKLSVIMLIVYAILIMHMMKYLHLFLSHGICCDAGYMMTGLCQVLYAHVLVSIMLYFNNTSLNILISNFT